MSAKSKCYIAGSLAPMQTSPLADQVFVFTSLSTFLAGAEPDMDLDTSNPPTQPANFKKAISCHYNPSSIYIYLLPLAIFREIYVIFSFLLFFSQTFICFNKLTIIDQKMILSLKEIQF